MVCTLTRQIGSRLQCDGLQLWVGCGHEVSAVHVARLAQESNLVVWTRHIGRQVAIATEQPVILLVTRHSRLEKYVKKVPRHYRVIRTV